MSGERRPETGTAIIEANQASVKDRNTKYAKHTVQLMIKVRTEVPRNETAARYHCCSFLAGPGTHMYQVPFRS